ncbi:hypothetical protein QOT17_016378 [Balamuthia mandrillaris]
MATTQQQPGAGITGVAAPTGTTDTTKQFPTTTTTTPQGFPSGVRPGYGGGAFDESTVGYGPYREPFLPNNTWRNQGNYGWELPSFGGYWRPRTDIIDLGNAIRVEFELPGIDEDSIHLEADQDTLILSSLKPQSRREENAYYFQNERHFGSFYRKLSLPSFVDNTAITAVMDNGVLKVTIPKSTDTTRRARITVQRVSDVTQTGVHDISGTAGGGVAT